MKFVWHLGICLCLSHGIRADSPPGYYDSIYGKSGLAFRAELHSIISDSHPLKYGDTDEALRTIDIDPKDPNAVILIYTRRSEFGDNFGETTGWNREHLWPNSYGIDDMLPAHSDLHNLRPADWNVRSRQQIKVTSNC